MKHLRHNPNAVLRNPWLYVTVLAMFIALLCAGCANTGKFIASTSTTVDATMQGWAIWVADGHATPEARHKVDVMLARYHDAEDVALQAYLEATKTGNDTALKKAKAALLAASDDLLALIASFQTTPTPKTP